MHWNPWQMPMRGKRCCMLYSIQAVSQVLRVAWSLPPLNKIPSKFTADSHGCNGTRLGMGRVNKWRAFNKVVHCWLNSSCSSSDGLTTPWASAAWMVRWDSPIFSHLRLCDSDGFIGVIGCVLTCDWRNLSEPIELFWASQTALLQFQWLPASDIRPNEWPYGNWGLHKRWSTQQ